MSEDNRPRIIITLEGGMVGDVLSDVPANVVVIDYDVDGVEKRNLTEIPQAGSHKKEYCIFSHWDGVGNVVQAEPAWMDEIFKIAESHD